MKRRLCFVPRCDHRHEEGWEHHVPPRRTAPTVHLRAHLRPDKRVA